MTSLKSGVCKLCVHMLHRGLSENISKVVIKSMDLWLDIASKMLKQEDFVFFKFSKWPPFLKVKFAKYVIF